MNRVFLLLHRWLALGTGAVVFIVALSGALVVFEGPIAEAGAVRVVPGDSLTSLDTMVAHARAFAGGGEATSIAFADAADLAYTVSVVVEPAAKNVIVNPYTGEAVSLAPAQTRLQSLIRGVHRFHTSLLAGTLGKTIVGFTALSSLLLVIGGIVLWWREKLWRVHWSASWKRIVFDLHHALGVLAALVLLVVTGTGAWMGFERQIDPLVLRLNRTPPAAGPPMTRVHDRGAIPISLDSVMRVAQAAIPGAPVRLIQIPVDGPVSVRFRFPEDHTPGGRSNVSIDRYGGAIVRIANSRTAEPGTRLMNLQRPLHTGDIFGVWSQVVWFLASVILASQAMTGLLMWWNGRAARQARDPGKVRSA